MHNLIKAWGIMAWLFPFIGMMALYEGDPNGGGGDNSTGGDGGGGDNAGGGDPNAGGAAEPTFLESLPEALRQDPSITAAGITDAASLATSFINAQKLIGKDKIALINENSSEEEVSEFFKSLGRPDEEGGYAPVEEDDLKALGMDKEVFEKLNTTLHKSGMSTKQGNAVKDHVVTMLKEQVTSYSDGALAKRVASEEALKTEFGDKYDHNIAVAAAVVDQFGDEALFKEITEKGTGDNPELIKFLVKVGAGMLEDNADGNGPNVILKGVDGAKAEITTLTADTDFQKKLMNREEVGHKEALAKWTTLFKQAYPSG